MKIDCISDLHGHYPELEGGDLLIVAGDLTAKDTEDEVFEFFKWVHGQPYNKKIVIGGNHDNHLQKYKNEFMELNCQASLLTNIEYICDSGTEFEGLKIWGSPWTKTFSGINPHCCAFTVDTDEELAEKWALIPHDIDILITHCPPWGIFDSVQIGNIGTSIETGSKPLRDKVLLMPNLELHIFGHIHEHGGKVLDINRTKFVNASLMNKVFDPVNEPVRIEL